MCICKKKKTRYNILRILSHPCDLRHLASCAIDVTCIILPPNIIYIDIDERVPARGLHELDIESVWRGCEGTTTAPAGPRYYTTTTGL